MYDRKMKELTIEYNIINKIIRKLKIRKEQVWNELKTLEEEANGILKIRKEQVWNELKTLEEEANGIR